MVIVADRFARFGITIPDDRRDYSRVILGASRIVVILREEDALLSARDSRRTYTATPFFRVSPRLNHTAEEPALRRTEAEVLLLSLTQLPSRNSGGAPAATPKKMINNAATEKRRDITRGNQSHAASYQPNSRSSWRWNIKRATAGAARVYLFGAS